MAIGEALLARAGRRAEARRCKLRQAAEKSEFSRGCARMDVDKAFVFNLRLSAFIYGSEFLRSP